ncbi:MAG: DUF1653 domain-containing protein [Roseburia sp.]|nr:DUF1653 domain-containing protein [Roseburia sp.]MCM1279764.1 DUF1653 domain-containing protein [Robinsoniella sp.]
MRNNPKPYEIYEHFKGNRYQIITLAQHSETEEDMVVYQAMYGEYKMYVRSLTQFMGMVDETKYPEKKGQYRFQKVSEEAANEPEAEEALEAVSSPEAEKTFEATDKESKEVTQEAGIDPMVMDFLDADNYEERLNILAALHHRITDDMINTMAISLDVEIEDGPIETRYEELKHCLVTFQKYQCSRVR